MQCAKDDIMTESQASQFVREMLPPGQGPAHNVRQELRKINDKIQVRIPLTQNRN